MHIETLAVHAGSSIDPRTRAVTPPIHLSTTFERAADGEYPGGFIYTRSANPTRLALEACLSQLEGGAAPRRSRPDRPRRRPSSRRSIPAIT